jgi:hypothetical protein
MWFYCSQRGRENVLWQTIVDAILRCEVNLASFLLEAEGDPKDA